MNKKVEYIEFPKEINDYILECRKEIDETKVDKNLKTNFCITFDIEEVIEI